MRIKMGEMITEADTLKKRFIAALRSGQYAQISGRLRDGDCFCPTGILADVIDPDAWYVFGCEYYWHGSRICLWNEAEDAMRNAGVNLLGVWLMMSLNDDCSKSLEEFADMIESGELVLF
jgi:hypothetical protein